jgi:hypothetical protein
LKDVKGITPRTTYVHHAVVGVSVRNEESSLDGAAVRVLPALVEDLVKDLEPILLISFGRNLKQL